MRVWGAVEALIAGGLVAGALILIMYTVLARWLAPEFAPYITEEVTVYMVMWGVLLAVGTVTRERQHIRADLVVQLMPVSAQRALDVLANLVGVAFALFLAWFGYRVAYEAWDFGDVSATTLRFPLWIYYSCLPVAAVAMALGHAVAAIAILTGAPEGHTDPKDDPA